MTLKTKSIQEIYSTQIELNKQNAKRIKIK